MRNLIDTSGRLFAGRRRPAAWAISASTLLAFALLAPRAPAQDREDVSVSLLGDADLGSVAIAATERVWLKPNVSVIGQERSRIVSTGTGGIRVENATELPGLYSVGPVKLVGTTVRGPVLSGNQILSVNSRVAGEIVSDTELTRSQSRPYPAVSPSGSAGSVIGFPLLARELDPGAYDALVVPRGATVRLRSGRYRFSSLVTASGGRIHIDTSAGPVEIFVEAKLHHSGGIEGDAASIVWLYSGALPVLVEGNFRGTLIANASDILLGHDKGAVLAGAFFGRNVVARPKTQIRHVTSTVLGRLPGLAPIPLDAITLDPRYDPSLVCGGAGLDIEGPAVDGSGDYFTRISYPAEPIDSTPGSSCRQEMRFCDADDRPVPRPSEEALNAPPSATASCRAMGNTCAIDPSTLTVECDVDADCGPQERCSATCTNADCSAIVNRCGSPFASCAGLPAETGFCEDDVLFQCPDPEDIGEVDEGRFARSLPALRESAPSAFPAPEALYSVSPFVSAQGATERCAPANDPARITRDQEVASPSEDGNGKWGFFFNPTLKEYLQISPKKLAKEEFELGAEVGVDTGAILFGKRITALSVKAGASATHCGWNAEATVKLFGDAVVAFRRDGNIEIGLGNVGGGDKPGTEEADRNACRSKFTERNNAAGTLRKTLADARGLREFYLQNGTTRDTCARTNRELGTSFDCSDTSLINGINVVNAWKEEYDKQVRKVGQLTRELEANQSRVSASGRLTMFDLPKRFSLLAHQQDIPLGPITLTLAVEGFGTMRLQGDLYVNLVLDGREIDGRIGNILPAPPDDYSPKDPRVVAGPRIVPSVGLSVLAYAGVGIPGVSVGIEGRLDIIEIAVPFDVRGGVARVSVPDPRDVENSDWAGPPTELTDSNVYDWESGWSFGSALRIAAMRGEINLAARIRLLFFKKTFRRRIVRWKGFEKEYTLVGDSFGNPIAAGTGLGTVGDDVIYNVIADVDPSDVRGEQPDAEYPGNLGQEPCVIVI